MKKNLFVILLVCILAMSSLWAWGKSGTTETSTTASTTSGSVLRKGVTYRYDDKDDRLGGTFSITFYSDGTLFFCDEYDFTNSSSISYFIVGNDIYLDSWFAEHKLYITNTSDGYIKAGTLSNDEKTLTIFYRRYTLELPRV